MTITVVRKIAEHEAKIVSRRQHIDSSTPFRPSGSHLTAKTLAPVFLDLLQASSLEYPRGLLSTMMMSSKDVAPADVARRITSASLYEYVVSHPGRSQYSRSGGGVSACGLATLNCARVIFELERTGIKNAEFICALMRREFMEVHDSPLCSD